MHMQPVFGGLRITGQGTRNKPNPRSQTYPARVVGGKVAEDLFNRGLCLPSGTAMTEKDLDRVISVIKRCKRK
jgi:dTDP-4-amino-4,6-dideoxygalactose transaminase